jgi:hypothetical protein
MCDGIREQFIKFRLHLFCPVGSTSFEINLHHLMAARITLYFSQCLPSLFSYRPNDNGVIGSAYANCYLKRVSCCLLW